MLTDNIILVFAIGGALALLTILQFFLAARHDHVVSIQGPVESLAALDAKIAARKTEIVDLERVLEDLRRQKAELAPIQAEIEALIKMRDDLLAEWNLMDERRAEVRNIRAETEEAISQRQTVEGELSALEERHARLKDQVEENERLVAQSKSLREEHDQLSAKIYSLRDTLQLLETSKSQVAELEAKHMALGARNAQLDGQIAAQGDQLSELTTRVAAGRHDLAQLEAERTKLASELAAIQEAHRTAHGSVGALEAEASALAARKGQLEEYVQEQKAQLADTARALSAERALVDEARSAQVGLTAEIVTVEERMRAAASEVDRLNAEFAEKQARLAVVEQSIRMREAEATGGTAGGVADDLRELKSLPPVLVTLQTWPTPTRTLEEAEALHRVTKRLDESGLSYSARVIRAFHTAMKVNETTQMTVLAGISGTGKSQLPRVYAAGMGIGFLQVPVQPRWDSPQDLMGFYNYIERRYRPTDMAKALWHLDEINNPDTEIKDRMMLILLDEMNLARVEYYFSDFLSRLESRPSKINVRDPNQRKDAEIELEIPAGEGRNPPRIFPGYNLLFAGTMNEDESTQSLSDKVVDRANVMRFAAPRHIKANPPANAIAASDALSRRAWEGWVRPSTVAQGDPVVVDALEKIVDLMKDFGRPIGHRVGRAIYAYVANYPDVEGSSRLRDALADQIEMRLLPKLRGVDVNQLGASAFEELRNFVESRLNDEVLAEAIGQSVEAAASGTGQFVWQGVTRE